MEFEFDKEIDTILRKARGKEDLSSKGSHLDADEISAFADNALPEAARMRFTMHLADCGRCRNILSNTFVLNEATATAAVAAAIPTPPIPWYRRLFVFPQLAYTMGALVLLFSGFFGYVLIKNIGSDSQLATAPKEPVLEKPATSTAAAPTAAANSAPTNAATPAVPAADTNANSAQENKPSISASPLGPGADGATANGKSSSNVAVPERKEESATSNDMNAPKPVNRIPEPQATPNVSGGVSAESRDRALSKQDQPADVKSNPADSSDDEDKLGATRSAPSVPKAKKAGAVRRVGGKTFNNVGGIWFDSAYNKQPTTTVKRNTDEYRNLDSGLRSVADQLGGTVVILWKNKGYRIQ